MSEFGNGHVLADFGPNVPGGEVLAHLVVGAHDVDGTTKYGVQAPDGSVHDLAYREPPYDDAGSGGTFRKYNVPN